MYEPDEMDGEERNLPFYVADIERFELNPVWREMVLTIKERLDVAQTTLQTSDELKDILKAQGDSIACQFFLIQPDLLKQAVKEQLEEQEKAKESEDE